MKVSGRSAIIGAMLFLLFLSSVSSVHWFPFVLGPSPVRAQPSSTAVVSIIPQNISDTNKTPQSTVTFSVNVSTSPSISAFGVWIQFDSKVLSAATNSIDYGGNVLGSSAQVRSECVNGLAVPGASCQPYPYPLGGPGIVSLELYYLGNKVTPFPTNGLLYKLTLTVLKTGFSQLHLVQVELANGVTVQTYPTINVDGFFTNEKCGANFCKPPFVDFTFSPRQPSLGSSVTFNASTTKATNPSAGISTYTWFWGDISLGASSSQTVNFPVITHAFQNAQNYSITLYATDTLGITWSVTKLIQVIYLWSDLTFSGITLDHQFGVIPGTIIKITASMVNNSTITANGDLTLTLDTGLQLGNQSFTLSDRGSSSGLNRGTLGPVTWNTTGYPPRVYRIDLKVTPKTPQNQTAVNDKTGSAFVQLIIPQTTGLLSLGLLQASGLGILILAALAVGVARFRKKPSYETEPLVSE